jgi:hypothetical protein
LRKAINENPVVQIAVLGGMAIVVGFLLFTRVLSSGSSEEAAPTDSATPPAAESGAAPTEATATGSAPATPAPTTTPPATGTAPPATGAVPPATEAVPGAPAPSTVVEGEFASGPGLPKPVVRAYDDGKAVVLFVLRRRNPERRPPSARSVDDRALRINAIVTELIERFSDKVAVFMTSAKNVHRYARITEGVDLNRVPAMIVVRPRRFTEGTPEATVEYGFRGPGSVLQTVVDAFYKGKTVSYDP